MVDTAAELTLPSDEYDDEWYLQKYSDVAEAVLRGDWISGYTHFCNTGRSEGRLGVPQINEAWYRKAYPLSVQEIATGRARDCTEHYLKFGRYRGYLTTPQARRPADAAHFQSKFGGLWTDQKNALDLVAGRHELGMITEDDAVGLTKWIQDGYVVLERAIEEETLQQALGDLERAYDGRMPNLKFAVHGVGQCIDWVPEARTEPTKALDIHWFSPAIRKVIFAPKVLNFMHIVFERRALPARRWDSCAAPRRTRIKIPRTSITHFRCNFSHHGSLWKTLRRGRASYSTM